MSSALWLRISSVIALLFAAGHTLGGRKLWSPMGETDVLNAMRTVRFEAMGVSRTYLDFYLGFGFSLSVLMLMQAVLLWQLAGIAKAQPLQARPMIAVIALASAACGVLAWRFIFPLPALFSLVLTATLLAAWFTAR
jgi:hypothetical protein